jgi:hypothetical protein
MIILVFSCLMKNSKIFSNNTLFSLQFASYTRQCPGVFIYPATVCFLTKRELLCKNNLYLLHGPTQLDTICLFIYCPTPIHFYTCRPNVFEWQLAYNNKWTNRTEPAVWTRALCTDYVIPLRSTHDISSTSIASWHGTKELDFNSYCKLDTEGIKIEGNRAEINHTTCNCKALHWNDVRFKQTLSLFESCNYEIM